MGHKQHFEKTNKSATKATFMSSINGNNAHVLGGKLLGKPLMYSARVKDRRILYSASTGNPCLISSINVGVE